MRSIKLMADYGAWPLWWHQDSEVGDIDPTTLPLSAQLKNDLAKWAEVYDTTLNNDYPPDSDFDSLQDELAFDREGRSLHRALSKELSGLFNVHYQSDLSDSHWNMLEDVPLLKLGPAEFAVLLNAIAGTTFALDAAALKELDLTEKELIDARMSLGKSGHLVNDTTPDNITRLFTVLLEPGIKAIVQVQSQSARWVQLAVHIQKNGIVVGEALGRNGERSIQQKDSPEGAMLWLVETVSAETTSTSKTAPLESLLPDLEMMLTWVVVNSAEVNPAPKATRVWLVTSDGNWLVTPDSGQPTARQVSQEQLHDELAIQLRNVLTR